MFENITIFLTAIFSAFFLLAPLALNAHYRFRAARFIDELLAENNAAFNRQVRTNAVVLLIRRSLWGLFVLSAAILNFRSSLTDKFNRLTVFAVLIGIASTAFGVWGYKNELKRLRMLK